MSGEAKHDIKDLLKRLEAKQDLPAKEAADRFTQILRGEFTDAQLKDFLELLNQKGIVPDEFVGALKAFDVFMVRVNAPAGAIDVCGTGGDGHNTLNVSTAVAFVLAACGVPVAKHGNRSVSSRSGSADVLEALGVRLDLTVPQIEACMRETNLGFMFAQNHHPAMKHVAKVRKELGVRTIFNLLGPMLNPARCPFQLVGVYNPYWLRGMAIALREFEVERAWLVHGSDGMDELTVTGKSIVQELKKGEISAEFEVDPEAVGLGIHSLESLRGGDAAHNAQAMRGLFEKAEPSAYKDIVTLNAAAALVVAGKQEDLKTAVYHVAEVLRSGAVAKKLDEFVAYTNDVATKLTFMATNDSIS